MEDNFLNEVFDEFHQPTLKKFTEVFRVERTKFGSQIVALTAIRIADKYLDIGKAIVNGDLKIDNVSIFNLQDKLLIGSTSIDKNIFTITGFKDNS